MITPANGGGQAAPKAGKEGEEKQVKTETEEKQVKTETEEKQVKMAILNQKHEEQVKIASLNRIFMLHCYSFEFLEAILACFAFVD